PPPGPPPPPPRPARGRPGAGVGAAPTAGPAVALPGPPRVSAAAVRGGLTGHRAETLWALPRPAQGQQPRARHPLPGDQKGRHQAQEEGHQDHQGRLTTPRPAPHDCPRGQQSVRPAAGLKRKLRTCANTLGCWLPGEVPEPDQGLNAVAQQPGAWALISLSKPGDNIAVAVRPDAAADPFDGLQLGVAEL